MFCVLYVGPALVKSIEFYLPRSIDKPYGRVVNKVEDLLDLGGMVSASQFCNKSAEFMF